MLSLKLYKPVSLLRFVPLALCALAFFITEHFRIVFTGQLGNPLTYASEYLHDTFILLSVLSLYIAFKDFKIDEKFVKGFVLGGYVFFSYLCYGAGRYILSLPYYNWGVTGITSFFYASAILACFWFLSKRTSVVKALLMSLYLGYFVNIAWELPIFTYAYFLYGGNISILQNVFQVLNVATIFLALKVFGVRYAGVKWLVPAFCVAGLVAIIMGDWHQYNLMVFEWPADGWRMLSRGVMTLFSFVSMGGTKT